MLALKRFSNIAYFPFAGEKTCPQSCSSATAVVLSPVYIAVIWQRVYISQYAQLRYIVCILVWCCSNSRKFILCRFELWSVSWFEG
jgi:hypothetical protein